jgi:hypothetical protein
LRCETDKNVVGENYSAAAEIGGTGGIKRYRLAHRLWLQVKILNVVVDLNAPGITAARNCLERRSKAGC